MTRLLVIGKRGGILHWYEDVLSAAGKHANGFSLTHHNLTTRLAGHVLGKRHPQVRRMAHGDLATALKKSRADLVIIIDLFYLEPAVNQLLKASGLPVVQWIGDRFESRLTHNTAVQRFFFTDTGLVDMAEASACRPTTCRWQQTLRPFPSLIGRPGRMTSSLSEHRRATA